jgi:hypothetical protein
MAYLDTSAIQRGLSDLGDALSQERKAYNTQQINTAKLLATQKMNDKINEMTNRKEFTGDWGLEGRQSAMDIAAEVGANIEDPQARVAFETEIQQNIESSVPQFRGIQKQKMTESVSASEALNDQNDLAIATKDWNQFATHVLTRYGEDGQTDNMIMASGTPQNAQKRRTTLIDQGAGSFVQSKVDQIMNNGQSTWAQKKDQLTELKRTYSAELSNGIAPSQPTMDKLDAAISGELAAVTTAAHKEAVDGELSLVSGVKLNLQAPHSSAEIGGYAFDPNKIGDVAKLKEQVKTKEATDALSALIDTLTVQADKGVKPDDADKLLKANLDNIKSFIQAKYKEGVSDANMDSLLRSALVPGKDGAPPLLDARNWQEAVAFTTQVVKLDKDPEISAAMTEFDSLPAEAKGRLAVAFKETVGGLNRGGQKDAFRINEKWDTKKLADTAKKMVEAEKAQALDTIIKSKWGGSDNIVEPEELLQYLQRASKGEFVGQITAANAEIKTARFTDALFEDLKKAGLTKASLAEPPSWNLYTTPGMPTFKFANGTVATPVISGDKWSWNITGGPKAAPTNRK